MISKDQLIEIVTQASGWSKEEIEQLILTQQYAQSLKVDQLKKIFRQLQVHGYHSFSTSVNKPFLVKQMQEFMKSYSAADGLFHYQPIIPQPAYTPAPVPLPVPSAQYQNLAADKPYHPPQQPHYPPASSYVSYPTAATTPKTKTTHTPTNTHHNTHQTPHTPYQAPSSSSSSNKRSLSQLSKQEVAIYRELCEIDGISPDDILSALTDCPPAQRHANGVLMYIIEKKSSESGHGPDLAPPNTKEQEDADLDRAILESEKERDHIQDRKRKRISSIREDVDLSIIAAPEFRKSVLLHGLPPEYHPTINPTTHPTSSSSSSSCVQEASEMLRHIIVKGSRMIRNLSEQIDAHYLKQQQRQLLKQRQRQLSTSFSSSASKPQQEVIDLCSSSPTPYHNNEEEEDNDKHSEEEREGVLFSLREALVRLLLIEFDALKYYGEVCYPYLISLAEAIDNNKQFNSHGDIDKDEGEGQLAALSVEAMVAITEELRTRKEVFEKGLFKLVRDGEGVPTMFRKECLKPYFLLVSHRLDSDGFELVGKEKEAVKFVEDVSEVEEDDEEDDFDDDDD